MLYILYEETKTVSMFETRNALFKMFPDLTVALFLEVKNVFFFFFLGIISLISVRRIPVAAKWRAKFEDYQIITKKNNF